MVSAVCCSVPVLEPFLHGGAGSTQIGVGEHRRGDVRVPGDVVADRTRSQAGLAPRRSEAVPVVRSWTVDVKPRYSDEFWS